MEFFFDNRWACHPNFEAARGVQNEQPFLLVDLQSVLGMLGEWVQLMYGGYEEVCVEAKQSWMFEE